MKWIAEEKSKEYVFRRSNGEVRRTLPGCSIIEKGLMVKSWETLHIVMVRAKFKKV